MDPFVVALTLQGRRAVVVGGDAEAADKALRLARAGALVEVFAPTVEPALAQAAREGALRHVARAFALDDLDPAPAAVISTSRDEALGALLQREARARGFLVCTVDRPAVSDFAHTSTLRAGPITVALSSGGAAPALLRRLRLAWERALSDDFVAFARHLAAVRAAAPPERRRAAVEEALRGLSVEVRVRLPSRWRAPA